MDILKHLWQQYATAAIVVVALMAGLLWGINIGRTMAVSNATVSNATVSNAATAVMTPGAAPAANIVATATPEATPTVSSAAEHVDQIEPGRKVRMALDAPPPGAVPPAAPQLRVRLDIRDDITEQPVRAEVWLVVAGREQFVAGDVSLIEFPMPGPQGTATVRVAAPGYQRWALTFNYKTKYNRLMPLPVRLEPEPVESGSGA